MERRMEKGELTWKQILIFALIVVGSVYVYQSCEEREKRAMKKLQVEIAEDKKRVGEIYDIIKKYNAVDDWENSIANNEFMVSSFTTLDLKRVWFTGRPIFFVGSVSDVYDEYGSNYLLKVTVDSTSPANYMYIENDPYFKLECSKVVVDKSNVLKNVAYFENRFAIIADIEKIQTEIVKNYDGWTREVRIGVGKCKEMVHLKTLRMRGYKKKEPGFDWKYNLK